MVVVVVTPIKSGTEEAGMDPHSKQVAGLTTIEFLSSIPDICLFYT